jgi:hypothetical protein
LGLIERAIFVEVLGCSCLFSFLFMNDRAYFIRAISLVRIVSLDMCCRFVDIVGHFVGDFVGGIVSGIVGDFVGDIVDENCLYHCWYLKLVY